MFPLMILSGLVQQIVSLTQNISTLSMMKQSERRAAERHEAFMHEFEKQKKKNAQENQCLMDSLKCGSKLNSNTAPMANLGQSKANLLQQACSSFDAPSRISNVCRQNEISRPLELIVQNLNWNCGGYGGTRSAA